MNVISEVQGYHFWHDNIQIQNITRPSKAACAYWNAIPSNNNELQLLIGIIIYLNIFSPSTEEVCEPLKRIMLKSEWTWNNTYHNLYKREIYITRKSAFMAFYSGKEQLCLETDTLSVSLRASFLHVRHKMQVPENELPDNVALQPIVFVSNSLTSA